MKTPKPGTVITAALHSTGGTKLTVTHSGFTAEVNGAELRKNPAGQYVVKQYVAGVPLNASRRVPTLIATDAKGKPHALHYWYDKWIGAYHRKLQFSREWETLDGQLLTPEMAAIADQALATKSA